MRHIISNHTRYSDFPVGTKVQIVTPYQDSSFFYGETGHVIRNEGGYLGIIVEFDRPRRFTDGSVQESFNFEPGDLIIRGGRERLYEGGGFLREEAPRLLDWEEEKAIRQTWLP